MYRLTYYELRKIWHKRSFVLSVFVLIVLNVFLLWYTNIPNDEQAPLSSYQSFQNKIENMSEMEKEAYICELKETIDGVCFVQEVLNMQNLQSEIGTALAEQMITTNHGTFEAYYEVYQSGEYLNFTNSLWQEKAFIDELYAEQQKIAGYGAYLESIQENEVMLSGISIFSNYQEESFVTRNVEKSAKDYVGLSADNIHWIPSKVFSISMESIWTDIFLILSMFLFAGNMILEEKEKKIYYVIRCTQKGLFQTIFSKMFALFVHCIFIAFLIYSVNFIFAEMTIGFGDVTANIQSVSSYMESNLSIPIWAYIVGSVFTKGMILFGGGAILTALCIIADNISMPHIIGFLFYGISFILYSAIPIGENGSLLKYINFIGLMRTENLYGGYLNFNIGDYPISRISISWCIILVFAIIGVLTSVYFFVYGNNFELKKMQANHSKSFRLHASLLRYESYKIMIMNRGIIIILLFGFLIGYRIMSQEYNPSAQEQYYQDLMMQLEGEMTEEKEKLILSEEERYVEAFSEIERIDLLVENGEISESVADNLKAEWYTVTFFYSSFERVLEQYQRIKESGGNFVYDTGYLYLFGKMNDDYFIDMLLLFLCIVIAFSNVIAMEYQRGAWYLLSPTLEGKKKIIVMKMVVCMIAVIMLSFIPISCRFFKISSAYPMHGFDFCIIDIPCYQTLPISVPIWLFIIILVLLQMLLLILATCSVLLTSYWRKNQIQTIFFALLILVVPIILKLLGLAVLAY